jgi:hypothetical protein
MINVGGYTLSWFGGAVALSVVLVLLSALVVFWGRKSWARLGAVVVLVAMLAQVSLLKPAPKESPKTIVVLQDQTASADTQAQALWLKTPDYWGNRYLTVLFSAGLIFTVMRFFSR